MSARENATPPNLRPASGLERCGRCIMYKSLDEYRNLIQRFGPGSPVVQAYGYGAEYLSADGICEVSGDPPVMESQVCDRFLSAG